MNASVDSPRLVADVGGTNARLGWQGGSNQPVHEVMVYPTKDHPSLQAAIEAYLGHLASVGRERPRLCGVGVACPVLGDQVTLTNHPWSFSIEGMRRTLDLDRLVVVNDFTAQALAMPGLPAAALRQVGGGAPQPGAPLAVLGPGTGLGVSGLLPSVAGRWVPLQGEGGHVSLSPCTPREDAVLAVLRERFGHASAERAISGMGLENVFAAVCGLAGRPIGATPAAEVTRLALQEGDAQACEAVALMCAFLGTVAGNLVLTLGAFGGVYLAGGILPRLGGLFDASPFRARFEAKGRNTALMQAVPTWLVTATESPALAGAGQALDHLG